MEVQKTSYPTFKEAFLIWLKVAIYSFGGPANQIAVMHRLIVEEKKWISEKRFLHALNYCMLLPGPEAQQLAVYIGWLLHKVRGGILAGSLFVLPGFLSILTLSILYAKYHTLTIVQTLFYGLKPAVIAIVLSALLRICSKTLTNKINIAIMICAFTGIFFLNIPFPIIILSAAFVGYLLSKINFSKGNSKEINYLDVDLVTNNIHITSDSIFLFIFRTLLWLIIWFIPVAAIIIIFGPYSIFKQEAIFFSKTAVVTFGGAYAVLSYIAQQAVQHFGWLTSGEMLDGLGMAETTPGPLIQVVQFVAFLAAYRQSAGLDPILAGIIGSLITTWVTYIPTFLWIFAGAPYVLRLRKITALNGALTAITAAVVGVILNLSVWFALNTLFSSVIQKHYSIFRIYLPDWQTFDIKILFIMICTLFVTFRYKANIAVILGTGILLGILFKA